QMLRLRLRSAPRADVTYRLDRRVGCASRRARLSRPLLSTVPMIRDDLVTAVRRALADAGLPEPPGGGGVEPPKQRDHGDWATNAALALAKPVGRRPLEIAEQLAAALEAAAVPHLARVEVAPPGFVNLYLAPTWLYDVLRTVVAEDERFG